MPPHHHDDDTDPTSADTEADKKPEDYFQSFGTWLVDFQRTLLDSHLLSCEIALKVLSDIVGGGALGRPSELCEGRLRAVQGRRVRAQNPCCSDSGPILACNVGIQVEEIAIGASLRDVCEVPIVIVAVCAHTIPLAWEGILAHLGDIHHPIGHRNVGFSWHGKRQGSGVVSFLGLRLTQSLSDLGVLTMNGIANEPSVEYFMPKVGPTLDVSSSEC
mmetsp:Transcript_93501/g.194966  ORF Transcript_93501/g.194966 Transcript_93501/m.194966 type:complete len:217 (-) Transcript_93501:3411-4061(-)